MSTVISVENLSKYYRLGAIGGGTLAEDLNRWWARLRKQPDPYLKIGQTDHGNRVGKEIWALEDVSFTVQPGEVLGIIGRNGAGKSTLLKILSRVTAPTIGRVKVKGRIASLLEVGTGFHPELTGRENVYLNGSILGMSRPEINRKFDEIVDFAEIEKFIDTPVKRYSSGMYVRLAFAVAAHLEPEILLVDEVLAVGDAGFQKKCLGKMGDVSDEGRTILFVSHNMAAIENLCRRSILLSAGQLILDGETSEVINTYIKSVDTNRVNLRAGDVDLTNRENKYNPNHLIIQKLQLQDKSGENVSSFKMGECAYFSVDLCGMSQYKNATIGIIFKTSNDQWISSITTGMSCAHIDEPRGTKERAILEIFKLPFTPGTYWIDLSVARDGHRLDYVEKATSISIVEADIYGTGQQVSSFFGLVFLDGTWRIEHQGE